MNETKRVLQRFDLPKIAFGAWLIAFAVVAIRVLVQGAEKHSVYPPYMLAAHRWLAGQDLYTPDNLKFRYSPLFAVGFTPFTYLSDRLGAILWRLINVGVFAIGLRWCSRTLLPRIGANAMSILFLIALPLVVPSLNNGQTNPLMTGLILCAFAALAHEMWTFSAALLVLAIFLKLYPLAAALLLVALYPKRLGWRFIALLLGGIALSFCLQSPPFVVRQFAGWFEYLRDDLRLDLPPDAAYRDLRLVLNVSGLHPDPLLYFVLQMASAAAIAIACVYAKRRGIARNDLLLITCSFASCWMLLLGPSTESCTYALAAAPIGWFFLQSSARPRFYRITLWSAAALLIVGFVGAWFPFVTHVHAIGEQPLAMLLVLGCAIYELRCALAAAENRTHLATDTAPAITSLP